MTFSTEATQQRSRKPRRCSWCWQFIETGHLYKRYRYYREGDAGTACMHPECFDAMQEAAEAEGGWIEWTPGQERPQPTEGGK